MTDLMSNQQDALASNRRAQVLLRWEDNDACWVAYRLVDGRQFGIAHGDTLLECLDNVDQVLRWELDADSAG
jgi:hypothetical protein